MNRNQMLARLTANCKCETDRTTINELSDETLAVLVANTGGVMGSGSSTDQVGGEEESDDGEDSEYESREGKGLTPQAKVGQGKMKGKPSINAWLAGAPEEVRSVVANAIQIERNQKTKIINRLIANLDGDTRSRMTTNLGAKSLGELREMLLLVGSQAPVSNDYVGQEPLANFFGASGGPAFTTSGGFGDADVLPNPTLNFAEIVKERQADRKAM